MNVPSSIAASITDFAAKFVKTDRINSGNSGYRKGVMVAGLGISREMAPLLDIRIRRIPVWQNRDSKFLPSSLLLPVFENFQC